MHEISLCRNVLSIIEEQANLGRFHRVKAVVLEVGALAGIETAALRFGFDAVMNDSIAAGAGLEIIHIPAQGWCAQCQQEVVLQQRFDQCPSCGAVGLHINRGDELRIKELEVE